ncbi:MAG: outer membrane protein [Pseudomonadota bacterium]
MGSHNKLSWIGALALATTTSLSANAADILPEPPVIEQPPIIEQPPEVVTKTGGWYLRGDISYDWVDDFDINYGGNSFTSASIDKGYNVGVGVGYQFTDTFRADITVDRFWSDFSGSTAGNCAFDVGGNSLIGSCVSSERAEFSAWSAMLNGYIDIGHFKHFTPYVGAGVGAAYVSFDNWRTDTTCTLNTDTDRCGNPGQDWYYDPAPGQTLTNVTSRTESTESSWRFSYALMAGISYELSHNLKLDAGYRYQSIASGTIISNLGGGGVNVDHDDLTVHSVRVGLRYQIW